METIYTYKPGTEIVIHYKSGFILQAIFLENEDTYIVIDVDDTDRIVDKRLIEIITRKN